MTRPLVLHVAQPTTGGVAAYVSALAHWQHSAGLTVVVTSPQDGTLHASCISNGVPWLVWPAQRQPGPRTLLDARRLRRIVRETGPSVVHLHSSSAGLAGRLVIRKRIPTLFQPHGWSFLAATRGLRAATVWWERQGERWSDVTICVSEAEAQRGVAQGVGGRQMVIHNGVAPPPPTSAGAYEPKSSAFRVVCLGRLTRQKGQDILLRAWPLVIGELPNAKLYLVGDGPDAESLKRTAPPGVEFVGWTTAPHEWLRRADVVAAPSRWEGMSLAVLQAMSLGRPVVATDVDGMREALGVGEDSAGGLVPPEDPVALAVAIIQRGKDLALASREGEAGSRRFREKFRQDLAFQRVTELTLELAALRGKQCAPDALAWLGGEG